MTDKQLLKLVQAVKTASRKLANVSTELKNKALTRAAELIIEKKDAIIKENLKDVANAKKNKLSEALMDRLTLNENRINEMSKGVKDVIALPDPVGTVISEQTRPSGIKLQKIKVPIGVICMIYESRPNVTIDSTALCLKSGNAVILRGGSEAINSNRLLSKIIKQALKETGLPENAVFFIDSTDRKIIYRLIKMDTLIDLVIPRGGEKMVNEIREQSCVPVLSHGRGLCATYIDKSADSDMAVKIVYNAKVQRPGVCNATETLLVHKDIAGAVLPELGRLLQKTGVQIRGCANTKKILKNIKTAASKDWSTEFHDLILAVKIVGSIEEAIKHINTYGSGHTDSIITQDINEAEKFLNEVDSSAVLHNASTRLHDGSVFGLGSEMGISTQKLHARGTMGLNELTSTKYIVRGTGQIRE
ncbi:MAG: glutamate-5-semialdehyde dehydrogenase [Elusimicrobia bacterium]|nr:glutamate-5-semialdehyde dehydrogenase [Elusimicrobiota bacterium]MBU2614074.1 glutamate-5-semialdehyde dehydrogenase [Elusimicrobiota bacterium]